MFLELFTESLFFFLNVINYAPYVLGAIIVFWSLSLIFEVSANVYHS